MMRLALRAVLSVLMVAAAPMGAAAHPPGVADKDQPAAHAVEALREFVKRAIDRKDARALFTVYADTYAHVDAFGRIEDKAAHIAAILRGEPTIENAPSEDVNYRVFGAHTIIVTGRSPNFDRRKNRVGAVRWLIVYVKAGDDWQIGASQITPVRALNHFRRGGARRGGI